ncbi:hypothetical protein [Paractinoplanes durhamensis]|uniref:Uncharacterized protein n=1 Tax=Paractinoplanes durhamensis TaxID=113563 RepID=A0ABQ3Z5M4_9ACTN|nr:hypothetical protein [Actinoplanes durhamensis]GIE05104.1 hypothetical protein Adu01nite_64540 [Actinoplanes durhamensis]
MPGFHDVEAITVYPTDPKDSFRVPTVEKAAGFEIHLEGEAGNGVTGPSSITPYTAAIQIFNLTQFKLVKVDTPAGNATGNIGVGQTWNVNNQAFVFTVAPGSPHINVGDLLEVIGTIRSGNPSGDATNDFSRVRSELFEVI